jgi:hypothetical protein
MHQEVLMNVSETQVNTPETHRWPQCAGHTVDEVTSRQGDRNRSRSQWGDL